LAVTGRNNLATQQQQQVNIERQQQRTAAVWLVYNNFNFRAVVNSLAAQQQNCRSLLVAALRSATTGAWLRACCTAQAQQKEPGCGLAALRKHNKRSLVAGLLHCASATKGAWFHLELWVLCRQHTHTCCSPVGRISFWVDFIIFKEKQVVFTPIQQYICEKWDHETRDGRRVFQKSISQGKIRLFKN